MNIPQVTASVDGASDPIPLNPFSNPFNVAMEVKIAGTTTVKVQYTLDNPNSFASKAAFQAGASWFDHPTLTGLTASNTGNIAYPVCAVRMFLSSTAGGSAILKAIQAGVGI